MAKERHAYTITGVGIGSLTDSLTSGRFQEVTFNLLAGGQIPVKITAFSNHANRDNALEFEGELRHKNKRKVVEGTYDWHARIGEIFLTDEVAEHFIMPKPLSPTGESEDL